MEDIGIVGIELVKKWFGWWKKVLVEEENVEEVVLEVGIKKKSCGRLRKVVVGGSDKVEVVVVEMKFFRRRLVWIELNEDDIVLI